MNILSRNPHKVEDTILEVPFYSQYEAGNGLSSDWQKRSCGILSLRMIIDYYKGMKGEGPVELPKLLDDALGLGGVDENKNWYHATLVRTASKYGFLSWRRSWIPSERDLINFRKEGVTDESINAWIGQKRKEGIPTLVSEIKQGYPAIISASPNFSKPNKPHLLVLSGVKTKEGGVVGFYCNDPYNKPGEVETPKFAAIKAFKKAWTYRAIFIRPKS